MEERYREHFEPLEGGPAGDGFELASVAHEGATLCVKVRGPRTVSLSWRDPVAWRVIDEGARLRQQPLREGKEGALVYVVDESVFLEELWRLSLDALKEQQLTHFLIWTLDQCVDVVAAAPPEIS